MLIAYPDTVSTVPSVRTSVHGRTIRRPRKYAAKMETGRVAGRVKILRPAGQAG